MDLNHQKYFHAAVSVDNVVFGFDETGLNVLLIYRGADPYRNCWALPGDLISLDTNLDTSAVTVLQNLTGLQHLYMDQIRTFGRVDRHPYGRVFTVAYFALIKIEDYRVSAQSWASVGCPGRGPSATIKRVAGCCARIAANVCCV
jgi:8-oxo-dGTP diphosphatase